MQPRPPPPPPPAKALSLCRDATPASCPRPKPNLRPLALLALRVPVECRWPVLRTCKRICPLPSPTRFGPRAHTTLLLSVALHFLGRPGNTDTGGIPLRATLRWALAAAAVQRRP